MDNRDMLRLDRSDKRIDSLRVLFFGTPIFSLPALKILWESKKCVGIVTQPDRKKGRGLKLLPSPVKQFAIEKRLPLFQPEKLSLPSFLKGVETLSPTIMIVVAYGKFLPETLREKFSLCVNFHPSLLPRYRGAAPIARAILRGEKSTGVTAHLVVEWLDAGDILWQETVAVAANETSGSLSQKLAECTAKGVKELLSLLEEGKLSPRAQDERAATYAPSLQRHEEKLHWALPAKLILNQIHAFAPSPGCYTLYKGRRLKVLSASLSKLTLSPGKGVIQGEACWVGTGTQAIQLQQVQLAGRQSLSIEAFCRGAREKTFRLG